ncbi:MAG: tryptophan 2,3-dioxygenase family protein [Bdellovibrionales bacterium]|jgi:tryptophan 2,3-dioxygenase|nr:tryptophan 2,3-dioxygenase family protein [Bdellovibrionales bacterium]
MSKNSQYPAVSYTDYLQTENLLKLQEPRSRAFGNEAHDEMLFIIVHQTYELWFRQILHELDSVLKLFTANLVREEDMGKVVSRITRITEIQRLLNDQVSVLETMTPLDFLDFRSMLYPASGFQSVQWRLIENKLGLRSTHRLKYNAQAYHTYVKPEEGDILKKSETESSLFDLVDAWLARTPFLETSDFEFKRLYGDAVRTMLESDRESVLRFVKTDEDRERNLKQIEETKLVFESLLDENRYRELQEKGTFRLQHKAIQAALLILLYRDQPIFNLPFQLLTKLQDMDELMTTWRYRHALMAHRMLGAKIGTGGSSGHQYLKAATDHHRVFSDFFNLATFLIPRSSLPELPQTLTKKLGFSF